MTSPDAFDYALPRALVAQAPAAARTASRLLVLEPNGHGVGHATFADLRAHLPEGALLVLNDSEVVPARMFLSRGDDKSFELLLCAPRAGQGPGTSVAAWVRGAKKLRPDDELSNADLTVRYLGPDQVDSRARRFEVVRGDVLDAARRAGQIPLPPYIERDGPPSQEDRQRYQTVYAREPGSVAAPTAGLHFTPELLHGVDHVKVTLHVGPGTFLPMDCEDVRQHEVGAETFEVSQDTATRINDARAQGRPIVAVGTTTTRALESVAAQHGGEIRAGAGETSLVITPGFTFRAVDHLLTNFHLPRSSLLMLVCALGGTQRVLEAYRVAVEHKYRFYSYGDCMLVSGESR